MRKCANCACTGVRRSWTMLPVPHRGDQRPTRAIPMSRVGRVMRRFGPPCRTSEECRTAPSALRAAPSQGEQNTTTSPPLGEMGEAQRGEHCAHASPSGMPCPSSEGCRAGEMGGAQRGEQNTTTSPPLGEMGEAQRGERCVHASPQEIPPSVGTGERSEPGGRVSLRTPRRHRFYLPRPPCIGRTASALCRPP